MLQEMPFMFQILFSDIGQTGVCLCWFGGGGSETILIKSYECVNVGQTDHALLQVC